MAIERPAVTSLRLGELNCGRDRNHSSLAGQLPLPSGFLDPKLFQTILQRAKRQAEQLGRLCDVVVGLLHRLHDQIAFDVFETDAFRRQLESPFSNRAEIPASLRAEDRQS